MDVEKEAGEVSRPWESGQESKMDWILAVRHWGAMEGLRQGVSLSDPHVSRYLLTAMWRMGWGRWRAS